MNNAPHDPSAIGPAGSVAANPFAPPRTHVEDVTASPLASPGARLAAAMIDMAISIAILIAASFVTGWKFWAPRADQPLLVALVINTLVGFVAFAIVHGWLLHTRGQTVGKMIVKLRIVRSDGSRAGTARVLLLRYLLNTALCSIPVIGGLYALVDCLMIFRASRKCVHDHIADTIVVRA